MSLTILSVAYPLAPVGPDAVGGAEQVLSQLDHALTAAGHRPEAHIFSSGGHGFGLKKQGTTSDHWIDEFYFWLEAQGLTRPAGKPAR